MSHVCSHWREVALASPSLWADIPIGNSRWAMEMIQRSKMAPLAIKCESFLLENEAFKSGCTDPYIILSEILCSHLPRIKSIALKLTRRLSLTCPTVGELLALIGQPAPMLERLDIDLFSLTNNINQSQAEIVVRSSRLQHLVLVYCRLTWNLEGADFRNLRSLVIKNSFEKTAYLLGILRQTPLLSSLWVDTVEEVTDVEGTPLPQNIDPINLEYLEYIMLKGGLPGCASLLDTITFSKKARIHINLCGYQLPISLTELLGQKIDDGIEGSILKLNLTNAVQCWKTKDTELPAQESPPTINVSFPASSDFARDQFWRLFHLDRLLSLDVGKVFLDDNIWVLWGDLPHLEDLRVLGNGFSLITALIRGLIIDSDAPPSPLQRPAFVRLRNLTIVEWELNEIDSDIVEKITYNSLFRFMIVSFELRKKAGLFLDLLRLQQCRGIYGDGLDEVKKAVKQVDWDETGYICLNPSPNVMY